MFRVLCAVGMHVRFAAILHAPTVAYPRDAPPIQGYPACSEGRVSSEPALTLRLSRMLRGFHTVGMHVQFDAILHAPRVVPPRCARPV